MATTKRVIDLPINDLLRVMWEGKLPAFDGSQGQMHFILTMRMLNKLLKDQGLHEHRQRIHISK